MRRYGCPPPVAALPMRLPRRSVRVALLAALLVPTCSDTSDLPDQSRSLDRLVCELSGTARKTEGVTSDSTGYEMGPGPGSLIIPIASSEHEADDVAYVLMAGQGWVEVSGVRVDLAGDYDWIVAPIEAVTTAKGTRDAVRIEVLDESSTAKVVDVTDPAPSPASASCALARVGHR